jgi:hypothetical protein
VSVNLVAQRRRTLIREFTFYDTGDELLTIDAGDVIEVRIGRNGSPALIEISSAGPTANGSTCQQNNPCVVVFHEDDVSELHAGNYDLEIVLVDASRGGVELEIERGVFSVLEAVQ